eukprot:GHRQ01023822.1.p1 GENE.GHRQ01023822.1~~GHRQ01023822.1.p1  ORF type:complete len:219 (+),score=71.91 GHRQ01023822.1:3-659(+)
MSDVTRPSCCCCQLGTGNQPVLRRAAAAAAAAITGSMHAATTPAEALLEVRAVLSSSCSWADAGHVVATKQLGLEELNGWQQAVVQLSSAATAPVQQQTCGVGSELAAEQESSGDIVITGPSSLRAVFSSRSGSLEVFTFGGCNMVEGLQPCFVRAPTDNDRGGFGGSSYAARWSAAGLERLGLMSKVRTAFGKSFAFLLSCTLLLGVLDTQVLRAQL